MVPASLLSWDTPSVFSGPRTSIDIISIHGSQDVRLGLEFHHHFSHVSNLQLDG